MLDIRRKEANLFYVFQGFIHLLSVFHKSLSPTIYSGIWNVFNENEITPKINDSIRDWQKIDTH